MNRRTVLFLLEEPSAQDLLQRLLPRVLMTGGVRKNDPRPELPQGAEKGADRSAGNEATPHRTDGETLELRYIVFQGKQDMEKRLVRRIRSWLHPNTFFVVLRDQDQGDCHQVKEKLSQLVREAGRPEALIRVVCRELESWLIGDWPAVAQAYGRPSLARLGRLGRYRDPDSLQNPAQELRRHVSEFQKRDGARRLGPLLDPSRNRSHSFGVFCTGLLQLLEK